MLAFDVLQEPPAALSALAGKRAAICLSGVTPAYAAAHGTDMAVNVDAALAAIRLAARAKLPRLFLASSAAVYGPGGGPFPETAPLAPVNDYGHAKARMEREGTALAARLGLPLCILRIGNVAGADAILGNWRAGMILDQLPDGSTPRRSYIGPRSLAHVLHALTCAPDLPAVLNIAAPGTVAMGDLLDAASLPWAPRPASENTIAAVRFDTSALEKRVVFTAKDSDPAEMAAQWLAMAPKEDKS